MKLLNLIFLTLLSQSVLAQNTIDQIPKPSGTYAVGRKLFEWVDESRTDPSDSSRKRTLPVWVWYPAQSKAPKANYPLNAQWRTAQHDYLVTKVGKPAADFLNTLKVHSVLNAPPVKAQEQFPVLLFGPGHTWLPTDYSSIIEDIVSHGYIVVGYVPTGFPGVTQLNNGTIVPGKLTVMQFEITYKDAEFIQSKLPELEQGFLKGLMDVNQLGFFGHSQGGITGAYRSAMDKRIKVYVNLDGDLMGSATTVRVRQPAFILSNDERLGINPEEAWQITEGGERSEYRRHADWVRLTDSTNVSVRIRLHGTRHLNFNDLALVPDGLMATEDRKNKLGTINGVRGLQMASGLSRMVFDQYLKGKAPVTYMGIKEQYPETSVLLMKGLPIK